MGRATNLSSRLRSYFSPIRFNRQYGKFIPLFKRQPLENFKLEVIFTGSKSYGKVSREHILEQYFLLQPEEFRLNTIRLRSFAGNSRAIPLYIYSRDGKICYYKSTKKLDFIRDLGISHITISKHLANKTFYLQKYMFSLDKIEGSDENIITIEEAKLILSLDRQYNNKNKDINLLSSNRNWKKVKLVHFTSKEEYLFPSLGKTLTFIRNQGFTANQRTLVKRLNTGIPYQNYICRTVTLT